VRLDLGGAALHLYDQPPRGGGRPLVHHLGLRTDDLDELVGHVRPPKKNPADDENASASA